MPSTHRSTSAIADGTAAYASVATTIGTVVMLCLAPTVMPLTKKRVDGNAATLQVKRMVPDR